MHYAITEAELDIFRQYQHGRIQKESSDMNAVKFKGEKNSLVNIWKPVLNLNSQHKSSLYSVRALKWKCWIGDGQNTRACLFFVMFLLLTSNVFGNDLVGSRTPTTNWQEVVQMLIVANYSLVKCCTSLFWPLRRFLSWLRVWSAHEKKRGTKCRENSVICFDKWMYCHIKQAHNTEKRHFIKDNTTLLCHKHWLSETPRSFYRVCLGQELYLDSDKVIEWS